MTKKQIDRAKETIVRYSLIGVAASAVAVVLASPAGLGGVVGISTASGFGAASAEDNPYARMAPFPAPVSEAELTEIRSSLAETTAALEATRAATDDSIAQLRAIATSDEIIVPERD